VSTDFKHILCLISNIPHHFYITAITAATFGKDGITNSYAEYTLPQSLYEDLKYKLYVSFFIRSRKPAGVIFSIRSNLSLSEDKQTAVVVQLVKNGLQTTLQSGTLIKSYLSPGMIADGDQHFIQIVLNSTYLTVELDSLSTSYSIDFSLNLVADVLFVGGIPSPSSSVRRRRDAASDIGFSGTLQDMRINGAIAEFFPQNVSAESDSVVISPTVLSNVASGELSDDICATVKPCQNSGICYNVFFSDYRSAYPWT
jgi:Laminin G domain